MKKKLFFAILLGFLAIFLIAAAPAPQSAPAAGESQAISVQVVVDGDAEDPEPGLEWLVSSWDQISDLLAVSVGGIPISILVLIVTLWAKSTNLAGTDDARRWWATGSALAFSLLDTAKTLTSYSTLSAVTIAETVVKGIMAALLASLVYKLPKFWGIFKDFMKSRQAAPK